MQENDIQQRVLMAIAQIVDKKEDEIQLDASIEGDLLLDSLQRMTLFIVLEDEFQRTIPPEEVADLKTVQDIIDFINEKIREASTA